MIAAGHGDLRDEGLNERLRSADVPISMASAIRFRNSVRTSGLGGTCLDASMASVSSSWRHAGRQAAGSARVRRRAAARAWRCPRTARDCPAAYLPSDHGRRLHPRVVQSRVAIASAAQPAPVRPCLTPRLRTMNVGPVAGTAGRGAPGTGPPRLGRRGVARTSEPAQLVVDFGGDSAPIRPLRRTSSGL